MGSDEERVIKLIRDWRRRNIQYIRDVREINRRLVMEEVKLVIFISSLIMIVELILKVMGVV